MASEMCDTLLFKPFSTSINYLRVTQTRFYWIIRPIRMSWANDCVVPNHSYTTFVIWLSLKAYTTFVIWLSLKAVWKHQPPQMSAMPCWWGPARPKQLTMSGCLILARVIWLWASLRDWGLFLGRSENILGSKSQLSNYNHQFALKSLSSNAKLSNMRKSESIAKFDGLESRPCYDLNLFVALSVLSRSRPLE